MKRQSYYWINSITFYRLLVAPVLIVLIALQKLDLFTWLLAISFFTDAIDGYLARHYKVSSVFGARLDSVADDLTILAALVGLVVFKSDFLMQHVFIFIILFLLFLIQAIAAFIRYRKMTSFHTYAAKLAAVMQGVFFILLFFMHSPMEILFYIAAIITALELIEEFIIVLLLPNWQTNVNGLYWVLKKK